MTSATSPVVDYKGRLMFRCQRCGAALTHDDFFDLGLRLPDGGESRGDYCAAELLDDLSHLDCRRTQRAAG